MAWQRFNRVTNVFEVSDNNGASWQTLVIAAAGLSTPALPANIAYKDRDNAFVAQTLASYSTISGWNSALYFSDTGAPAGSRDWRFLDYNNGEMVFEAIDGSGGVVCQFIYKRNGDLGVSRNIQSAQLFPTDFYGNGNLHTRTGHIYPTAVTSASAHQGSWYIGAHSSYGLYTNTGLYIEGGVWNNYVESRNHVRGASAFYDFNKGWHQGQLIDVGPSIGLDNGAYFTGYANTTYSKTYINGGNQLLVNIVLRGATLVGTPYFMYINIGAHNPVRVVGASATIHTGGAWGSAVAYMDGATNIVVHRAAGTVGLSPIATNENNLWVNVQLVITVDGVP